MQTVTGLFDVIDNLGKDVRNLGAAGEQFKDAVAHTFEFKAVITLGDIAADADQADRFALSAIQRRFDHLQAGRSCRRRPASIPRHDAACHRHAPLHPARGSNIAFSSGTRSKSLMPMSSFSLRPVSVSKALLQPRKRPCLSL